MSTSLKSNLNRKDIACDSVTSLLTLPTLETVLVAEEKEAPSYHTVSEGLMTILHIVKHGPQNAEWPRCCLHAAQC
jgi:hypothetical protein